jgi:uncharacterized OB-fold protein
VAELDAQIASRKKKRRPLYGTHHEDGQTCPRCGDLYAWDANYCPPCRRLLK